ncbi:hypothetical protein HGRIS_010557 [Hohenbuehelia grisea]
MMMAIGGLTIGQGLLNATGDRHKRQKKMLGPIFNIAHMRSMMPIFHGITHKLRTVLHNKVANGPKQIDMLEWVARTALELVGQAGLGFSFDPLTEDGPVHPYSASMKNLAPTVSRLQIAALLLFPWGFSIGSAKFKRWIVDMTPWPTLHKARDMVDLMDSTTRQIYLDKLKAIEEGDEAVSRQIGKGKDIIAVLMKENENASEEDKLPEQDIVDQMSTLTFAAMDTTSSTISRVLQLLTMHPDVQEKVHEELVKARAEYGNDIPYNELVALPWLDAVCRETLRMYPPIPTITRTTLCDTVLPLATPIIGNDGKEIREIPLPKDTHILVSLISSNRNPAIWGDDCLDWKPERWLKPLPDSVKEAHVPGVYSNLMSFLGGYRACIGFKFSQLEMKAVLSELLATFKFAEDKSADIHWDMSLVTGPYLKTPSGAKAALPMVVSLA